jgi:predicted dehydrogenase
MSREIRLGVVGGQRGKGFGLSLASLKGTMRLSAICDIHQGVCDSWKKEFPDIRTFTDYSTMLDSGDVDAVLLATPMPLHVPQSVEALRRGIHAASEVTACISLAEGRRLIEATEKSKAVYFFAENYVYSRTHMMIEQMCRKGVFGEISYIHGGYYHDCRSLMFNKDGSLTWRGLLRRDYNCHTYPTHTLGPIDRWLGVREGRDRFVSVSAFASKAVALSDYAAFVFGKKSRYAKPQYFRHGDTIKVEIKTANGVLIDMLFDPVSPRVGDCAEHFITATKACFHSNTAIRYADGLRAGPAIAFAPKDFGGHPHWEPLYDYAKKYEHPLWKECLADAQKAGHGGGDFFILRDFARAIRGGTPAIDVYDAVLWSSIVELSAKSIAQNGKAVAIPVFRPGSCRK